MTTEKEKICQASVSSYMSSLKAKEDDEPWRCHNKVKSGEKYCWRHKQQMKQLGELAGTALTG